MNDRQMRFYIKAGMMARKVRCLNKLESDNMDKRRIVSVLLALAFLTLAGCQSDWERPSDAFLHQERGGGP